MRRSKMPRALTIQRTLVTPADREKFAEKLKRKHAYYAQAGCRYGCSRRRACRARFSSSSRRPTPDARARPCRGARARARSGANLSRSGASRSMPTRSITHRRARPGASCRRAASRSTTATSSRCCSSSGSGDDREVRVTRYSPHGTRSREQVARRAERRGSRAALRAVAAERDVARGGLHVVTGRLAGERAFVDLHMHSTASDGSRAPAEVVRAAKRARARRDRAHGSRHRRRRRRGARRRRAARRAHHHRRRAERRRGRQRDAPPRPAPERHVRARARPRRACARCASARRAHRRAAERAGRQRHDRRRARAGGRRRGRAAARRARARSPTAGRSTSRDAFDRYLGAGRPAYVPRSSSAMRDAIAHDPRRGRARGARASRRRRERASASSALVALGTRRRRGQAPEPFGRRTPRGSRALARAASGWCRAADPTGTARREGPRTIGMMQVPAEWLARQEERLRRTRPRARGLTDARTDWTRRPRRARHRRGTSRRTRASPSHSARAGMRVAVHYNALRDRRGGDGALDRAAGGERVALQADLPTRRRPTRSIDDAVAAHSARSTCSSTRPRSCCARRSAR